MTTAITMGIISVVLGFMITVLAQFPIQAAPTSPADTTVSATGDPKTDAEQAARGFSSAYTGVIDDMMSHIKNPDYQRAERSRQAMVSYATYLIPQYQNLANDLQTQLNDLTAEGTEEPAQ